MLSRAAERPGVSRTELREIRGIVNYEKGPDCCVSVHIWCWANHCSQPLEPAERCRRRPWPLFVIDDGKSEMEVSRRQKSTKLHSKFINCCNGLHLSLPRPCNGFHAAYYN
jgi:hypothetical protein